jgi:hypothetical protein
MVDETNGIAGKPEPILNVEAKVAFLLKQADMERTIEKPPGKYRIIQNMQDGTWTIQAWAMQKPPPNCAPGMWERWWSSMGRYDHLYNSGRAPENWLDWTEEPRVSIVWSPFGQNHTHGTYESAERWLKGWINPVAAEVYFDDAGKVVKV